jgi:hypothetical protein
MLLQNLHNPQVNGADILAFRYLLPRYHRLCESRNQDVNNIDIAKRFRGRIYIYIFNYQIFSGFFFEVFSQIGKFFLHRTYFNQKEISSRCILESV